MLEVVDRLRLAKCDGVEEKCCLKCSYNNGGSVGTRRSDTNSSSNVCKHPRIEAGASEEWINVFIKRKDIVYFPPTGFGEIANISVGTVTGEVGSIAVL